MSLSKFVETNLTSLLVGTAAAAVSIYVLYGPNQARRKQTDVRGLVNTGNSCFVNAVLQALAACPSLYYWLQRSVKKSDDGSLRWSLFKVLGILNNLESDYYPNPFNPVLVLHALRSHGWFINREEQDAHEMLNVLMTTLEEEIRARAERNKPTHASLLDISNIGLSGSGSDCGVDPLDMDFEDDEELSRGLGGPFRTSRRTRGVSLPPESLGDAGDRNEVPRIIQRSSMSMSRDASPHSESKSFSRHRRSSSGVFSKFGEQDYKTLESLRSSRTDLSPFTGMLTSKLSLSTGKPRSPVKYSSFNNITLNLPPQGFGFISLEALLQIFISQESVENSEDESNFIKQLTFGKLPECLSFHIQRTGFSDGHPFKRHEFVEFPALLSMNKYIYSNQLLKQKAIAAFAGGGGPASLGHQGLHRENLYSLRAVIVHSGGINSGHYVTYRKGPIGSKTSNKWFYTSDNLVKQVPYSEVCRCSAYMLFYQKDHHA